MILAIAVVRFDALAQLLIQKNILTAADVDTIKDTVSKSGGIRAAGLNPVVLSAAYLNFLERLFNALKDLHPEFRLIGQKRLLLENKEQILNLKNLYLKSDLGCIDFLSEVSGIGGFKDVFDSSIEISLFGMKCRVLSIDALIKSYKVLSVDIANEGRGPAQGVKFQVKLDPSLTAEYYIEPDFKVYSPSTIQFDKNEFFAELKDFPVGASDGLALRFKGDPKFACNSRIKLVSSDYEGEVKRDCVQ